MIPEIVCEECESVFSLKYDPSITENEPGFCPFCGEKLFLDEDFVHLNKMEDLGEGEDASLDGEDEEW